SLLIESQIDQQGAKKLWFQTNEAKGYLEGRYELSKLPASFRLFLSKYYPALIKTPDGEVAGQDFSFEINTGQIEPFLKLFDKQIAGGNFSKIFGSINTETRQLLLSADVPSFQYGSVVLTDIEIQGSGSENELNVYASAENLRLNEKITFPKASFKVATIKDSTRISLNTQTSGPFGNAALNADFFSQPQGFALEFLESSFIAGKKKWTIEQGRTDPSLEGIVSGEARVVNPTGVTQMDANLDVDQFYFNADSIGRLTVKGRYSGSTHLLNAVVKSENPAHDFWADVGLDFNEGAALPLNSKIILKNERLTVLRRYLTDVFDSIDGYANGELAVIGAFDKPSIVGKVQVSGAEMLVGYTQCRYMVDSATLEFGDNFIDFGQLRFRDAENKSGRVEGRFYHRFFDSMYFNMRLRTDGMLVLNTGSKDNDLFYGNVTGKASLDLTGPLNNLQMRIVGAPTDSSWIAISNEESRTTGEADYIVFKKYGITQQQQIDTATTNIHILLELSANPLCRVDVVLDELTGDIISARGNGILNIKSGTVDPTEMRGRFNIQSGSYNYTFQTFIRKPFILDGDGNNFLEWSGDPYEANMSVKATYIARDVSLRDLVSNESSTLLLDQNAKNYKGDVFVNADITGNLSRPDIDFSIEFPPGSVMRNNITANDLLRRISEDESENLRQVTYLIVFRSFAPFRQGAGARNPGADLAVNTISELVSGEMEKILTGVIQDLTRDKSLSVDLSTNFYNSSQTLGNVSAFNQYDRVNFDFNLNRSFFNSRVKVNLGSDFDLNVRNTTATGFQFLPDVSVEFILTANRRLRAIVFKRDNLDISGRRNRAGASISYRKDFERLFGRRDEEALFFIRDSSNSRN
ncbi:MAG: translocation/assembly module TamB, partial [Chitinophagaceae bacterium]|nr:translocation/assembly module TamB [Chitinophagaceae bacterium]